MGNRARLAALALAVGLAVGPVAAQTAAPPRRNPTRC